jgi:hypothetical protein
LVFEGEGRKVCRFEIDPATKTIWASQAEIADLFGCSPRNVGKHTKKIFADGELDRKSVANYTFATASDGKRYRIEYFNLKLVIAVGSRIGSSVAVRFRIWVNDLVERRVLSDAGFDPPSVGLIAK